MKTILTIAVTLFIAANIQAQTAREIVQSAKDRPDGDTRTSEMTMKLISKKGKERERKITSYSIDVGTNKDDVKTLIFFEYPGDVKGTGFLT